MCKVSWVLSPRDMSQCDESTGGQQRCGENAEGIQSLVFARKQNWNAQAAGPVGRGVADEACACLDVHKHSLWMIHLVKGSLSSGIFMC